LRLRLRWRNQRQGGSHRRLLLLLLLLWLGQRVRTEHRQLWLGWLYHRLLLLPHHHLLLLLLSERHLLLLHLHVLRLWMHGLSSMCE
jgi:hypothetical protein